MKPFCLFILFSAAACGLPSSLQAGDSDGTVYLGHSKIEITPSMGTPLSGYGKRRGKPSLGIHDPLFVRALSLSRNNQLFVFVSVDLVLVDEPLRKAVLKKVRKKNDIADASLLLFATHNHSGAGAVGRRFWERFIMGKFRKKTFETLTFRISEAVLASMDKQVPVEVRYGEITIGDLIENRMDERLNTYPASHTPRLKVLQFFPASEAATPIANLIFMAAHPTLMPALSYEFSADFPGVLTGELEKEFPGSIALFANGAAADIRPHTGPFEDKVERMEAYGFALFKRVQEISLESINLKGPWQGTLEKNKLPRVRIRQGWLKVPSLVGNRFFPRKSYFQAVRMGPLLFLTFPGEISSEIGREIEERARAKFFNPFIIGYANDYLGYVIPHRHYKKADEYESRASFYGPKMAWFVQKKADQLTDRILSEEEKRIVQTPGRLVHKNQLPVLTVHGDPYFQGYEEGRLLQKEIQSGTREIFRYFRSELPIPLVNRLIINGLLDRSWKKMEPYVSYSESLQMRGIADGARLPFRMIRRIHALPEVYPTWCTNGAYWGPATRDGRLIAIRNLDWNRKIGIHRYAVVRKFSGSHESYVNIGYAGFSGVLSGVNENGISVGQIGATSDEETMEGVPMPFLLKRILSASESLDDAKAVFKQSNLTRGYNYVIADALHHDAFVAEATAKHLAFFGPNDPKEKSVPYAFPLDHAVFRGDPALDPVIRNLQKASGGKPDKEGLEMPKGSAYEIRYLKHGKLVQDHYGAIDPEVAKQIAREIAPGSNIQSVVYAFPDFWVANAEGNKKAAEMEYVKFAWEELQEKV